MAASLLLAARLSLPLRITCITALLPAGFRDTAYTYMDPHTFPSGGDWTIARSGVVALTNTERVAISGCIFSRVDGNAVLIARCVCVGGEDRMMDGNAVLIARRAQ